MMTKSDIKKLEKEGEAYYEAEKYEKALKYFLQLNEIKPNDPYYNLVLGICYSYYPDEREQSLVYLSKAKELSPDFDQVDLYLGRAQYKNQKFNEAISTLQDLLAKEESDQVTEDEANKIIAYCKNALLITGDTLYNITIKNLGDVINTEDDEYVPLVTSNESTLIFTYRGEKSLGGKMNNKGEVDDEGDYFEDIMMTKKSPDDWMYDEDIWLDPVGIESLNSDLSDACIALSVDGQTLFLYKSDKTSGGDIYYSVLDSTTWGKPQPILGDVNTKNWEGSVSIASDGMVLYFSSDKPGGFGGRDLYRADKRADGTWGNVTNLGPSINTPLNDDSPFLHLDRRTLYFSSEGHNSMGGYDVFYSVKDNDNWLDPVNMGAPVNTTENDMFYVATSDGKHGYYSSDHGEGHQGRQDIYRVTPDPGRLEMIPVAALIVGIIFADDVPSHAEIIVTDVTNNKPGGTFLSNAASGEYIIALLPGAKYKLEVNVENFEPHLDEIDLETLHEYIEVSNNIYVYSETFADVKQENTKIEDAYVETVAAIAVPVPLPKKEEEAVVVVPVPLPKKEEDAVAVVPVPIPKKEEEAVAVVPVPIPKEKEAAVDVVTVPIPDPCGDVPDLSVMIGKDLNIEPNYNELLGMIGEYCSDELEYRVQIGAYRFPKNFKYANLDQFGEADINDYPDGITRFTMGSFRTLQDADDLRQQIRTSGQEDAWVIPFFDGQRIFMEDLIEVNFYKRAVN